MSRSEMVPLDEAMREALGALGLADPGLMSRMSSEWSEVAGEPWAGGTRPVYLRQGTLVVEVAEAGRIPLLRYGAPDLGRRLSACYGPDIVTEVEIRAVGRQPGQWG